MKHLKKFYRHFRAHTIRNILLLILSVGAIFLGVFAIWFSTLEIPDLQAFQNRKVSQSTKIFDRTGKILLYDVHANAKRTIVPLEQISKYIQKGTIAIEDADFYNHFGIKPTSIIRAIFANITSAGYAQGGSTITQQVVKNTILTNDKTITRKLKEWVLAIKLEKVLTKDQILATYLNETSYGGSIYGVEEASRQFFGKTASEVSIAEAAYLSALPQAPSFYSPFGKNKTKLDERQKLVLKKMLENKFITEDEYASSTKEKVVFLNKNDGNIKAPHFSLMVRDYLIDKYGEEKVMNGGLKVTTSLDYDLQTKAEDVVTKFSPILSQNFNASNTAMTAVDPRNGDILMMVGSKDYFDQSIDGNVNIVTAHRQPGSSFKPFVYAAAWEKGYTPSTVLFDTKTEFSSECDPEGKPKNKAITDPKEAGCYSPVNYDDLYEGPMTMKQALAQSRNIPAVKTLYLAGINDSLRLAKTMGISTLGNPDIYGLTLVLGGGEVTLLDMVNAYGVFANEGIRIARRSILKVEDSDGNVLEESIEQPGERVLSDNTAREISDALSDKKIRLESLNTSLENVRQDVAVKTGTTNDYKDVWIIGYTPDIVVGAWAGKNDNTPMEKKVAGVIITPVWGEYMTEILKDRSKNGFNSPDDIPKDIAPVLRGVWQGNVSYILDKISKKIATEFTPDQTKSEQVVNSVHSILHWIDKDNPLGPIPENPENDNQYLNWEYGVRKWFDEYKIQNPKFTEAVDFQIPTEKDDVHTPANMPKASVTLSSPGPAGFSRNEQIEVNVSTSGKYPANKMEYFINNSFGGEKEGSDLNFTFRAADFESTKENNELTVIVYDSVFNSVKKTIPFIVKSD